MVRRRCDFYLTDGADAKTRGQDRANGAATGRVIPHHHLLDGDVPPPGDLLDNKGGGGVGGVALVRVVLDHNTLVELGAVPAFVLVGIVWVGAMGLVSANNEALGHRLLKGGRE